LISWLRARVRPILAALFSENFPVQPGTLHPEARPTYDEAYAAVPEEPPELVEELLARSKEVFEDIEQRRATIEQKATGLLAATSLSATLLAASTAILLKRSDFVGRSGLLPFGILVMFALVIFLYSAYKAMRSLRVTQWGGPDPGLLLEVDNDAGSEFKRRWIAQLVRARAVNELVAGTKGGWLGEAQAWFVLGILVLVFAAGALLVAVAIGDDGDSATNAGESVATASATNTVTATDSPTASASPTTTPSATVTPSAAPASGS